MKNNILNNIVERAYGLDIKIVLPEFIDTRVKKAESIIKKIGINPIFPNVNIYNSDKYLNYISNLKFTDNWTEKMMIDYLKNPLHLGAVMVALGEADGMVAGAVNSSSKVLRTALRIIGIDIISPCLSSNFLMLLSNNNQAFTFTDCAVIPEPTPEQSANLAYEASKSHRLLTGEEPKIAFLSFSTNGSSEHYRVQRVKDAVSIFKKKFPKIICEGELQFDAAIIPSISNIKFPNSSLNGNANVFVFPNLDAGNIAYKLMQRLAGAIALGPILQGLKKPINDLSRGCSVDDIVHVTAITALQKNQIYA